MQIKDLYQTSIDVVKKSNSSDYYNLEIDASDVQVIVTLKDFNGYPIYGKQIVLSVDKGYFLKYGGGVNEDSFTVITDESTKTVTVETDTKGQVSAIYKASEFGLCTFSVNSSKVQVNVSGWKLVNSNNYYKLYVDESIRTVKLVGINSNASLDNSVNWTSGSQSSNSNHISRDFIPSKYTVDYPVYYYGFSDNHFRVMINNRLVRIYVLDDDVSTKHIDATFYLTYQY